MDALHGPIALARLLALCMQVPLEVRVQHVPGSELGNCMAVALLGALLLSWGIPQNKLSSWGQSQA